MSGLQVTPGFWLLLAAVWFLDPVILLPALLAAACHELGHCAALRVLGVRVRALRLSALGAELTPAQALPYALELPVALAGPCASLLCAALAARWGRFLFAGLSLALGVFNLLPILPLDGGRAVGSLCALLLPAPLDRGAAPWLGVAAAGVLLGAAVAAAARLGALALLPLALWLCVQSVKALLGR